MVLIDQRVNTRKFERSCNSQEVKQLFNSKGFFSDWGVDQLRMKFRVKENDAWQLMFKPIKDLTINEKALIAFILNMRLADLN